MDTDSVVKRGMPMTYRIGLMGILLLLMCQREGISQQLAFPGAEGFGRFATGGRGGEVYYVTNLNDDGPGSLRDAVSEPNRTILFKVSGTIFLNKRLLIAQDNITIAGQTAPGDGICIAGHGTSVRAKNIIIRYLRFRLGDINTTQDDALNASGVNRTANIIIDHCSLSWSVDETGSFYAISDFTVQWCLLSESLYSAGHAKNKTHGFGGIWGGANASFHHNLFAHHSNRNPRFSGSFTAGWPDRELVDFRNNVIYNWGNIGSVYGGESGRQNVINNYYKPGPATPGTHESTATNFRNRILGYTSYSIFQGDTIWGGKFYVNGNYVAGHPDVSEDNWPLGVQADRYPKAKLLIANAKADRPFPHAPVTTHTAEEAYSIVLDDVGATLPKRDALDKRIIHEVTTGTAIYEGRTYAKLATAGIGHPSGIIDSQYDVGGWPHLASDTAPLDSDGDGIPDWWEVENQLDFSNPEDARSYADNGYTILENYLNSIEK